MRCHRWNLNVLPLLLVAGWAVLFLSSCAFSVPLPENNDDFEIQYEPFPVPSKEELTKAMQSLPPGKPGPLLPVERAQSHLSFQLMLARCQPVDHLNLQGVKVIKRLFPDGRPSGSLTAWAVYEVDGKKLNLIQHSSPNARAGQVGPDGSMGIKINNESGWLWENKATGWTDVSWLKGDIYIRLFEEGPYLDTESLIKMAECIQ